MNEESYRAFLRAYGSMTAGQVWRMIRDMEPPRPVVPEGPMQGMEASVVIEDEMQLLARYDAISWDPARVKLSVAELAGLHTFNENAPPEKRVCLREGACVGDGAQVNWCPTVGTWLCAACLVGFSDMDAVTRRCKT